MEYKHREIKNFLPKEQFKSLQDLMFSNTFPWFFQPHQTENDGYFMSHNFFYNNKPNSIFYEDYIMPILNKIKINMVSEVRANLLFKTKKHIQSDFHVDKPFYCNTALLYMNTNNGYTILKNKIKIKTEENKLLIIDTKTSHAAVSQTDTDRRIVINFNYL